MSAGRGSDAGSYLRLVDSCITQLKARACNESEKEERGRAGWMPYGGEGFL